MLYALSKGARMSLDRGSTESFFKAGTVRIPPSGRGMIYLVPNSDDLLSLPAVKIIERV